MTPLFEPFQTKIQLHIDGGFLQRLWDKYVPASNDFHDRISLIYLNDPAWPDRGQPGHQTRLLAGMALHCLFLQLHIRQNRMLLCGQALRQGIRHSMKVCLEQLKRSDVQTFRSFRQYLTYLEGEEEENRRYQEWQRESRLIRQLREEHRALLDFSLEIRRRSAGEPKQDSRLICRDILQALGRKGYEGLEETFVWRAREALQQCIRQISEEQYQRILRQLEQETELYGILAAQAGKAQETEQHGIPAAQAKNLSGTERAPGKIPRGQLLQSLESLDQKTLWKICQKAVFVSRELRDRFSENLKNLQESIQAQAAALLKQEKYSVIANSLDDSFFLGDMGQIQERLEEKLREQRERIARREAGVLGRYQDILPSGEPAVSRWMEEAEEDVADRAKLESLMEEIRHHAGEGTFPSVYQEGFLRNPSVRRLIRHLDRLGGEQRRTFVRELSDVIRLKWRRMGEERQGEFHREEVHQEELHQREVNQGEILQGETLTEFSMIGDADRTGTVALSELLEWGDALLVHPQAKGPEESRSDTGTGERFQRNHEGEKRGATEPGKENQAELIRRQIGEAKDRAKLQSLIEQISHYAKEDTFHPMYREGLLQEPSVRQLIRHMDRLGGEQYRTFVRELSDVMLLKWRRMGEDRQEEFHREEVHQGEERQAEIRQGETLTEFSIVGDADRTGTVALSELLEWGDALLVHPQVKGPGASVADTGTDTDTGERFQKLAYRIQAYEERRQEIRRERIRQFEAQYSVPEHLSLQGDGAVIRTLSGASDSQQNNTENQRSQTQNNQDRQIYRENRNLRYAVADAPQNRQIKPEVPIQEDTIRLKSAQEQLSARIKEIEQKLTQTEHTAGRNEDPKELAEKVKRQLQEELHLEKLRRGMT